MASFVKFSAIKAFTVCVAFTMTAGMTANLALAGDGTVLPDQIVHALQPKPLTRGLSMGEPQIDQAARAKENTFLAERQRTGLAVARRARGDRLDRLDQAEHRS